VKISYYPGCSLEGTAKEYDQSSRAVCRALGLELEELDNWNCCGSTAAHSTNNLLGAVLPAKNIALAQEAGMDMAIPCSACFARTRKSDHLLRQGGEMKEKIEKMVGFKYNGQVNVLSLLEAIITKVGFDAVKAKVKKPLTGLKLACYYGCLMVRPPEVRGFDDVENPVMLDRLMQTLGAEVVPWSYKTDCCGASLSLTKPEMVENLVDRLIAGARASGAQAVITACPLCQSNLEMRQTQANKMPAIYFTEAVGMALELPEVPGWFNMHLIEPGNL